MHEEKFWKLITSLSAILLTTAIWGTLRYQWQPVVFTNSDFEAGDLRNWTAEGQVFLHQPIRGDKPAERKRGFSAHVGKYWIGTFEAPDPQKALPNQTFGDLPTGRLVSTTFRIARDKINFLIGAGNGTRETSVSLLVDNRPVLVEVGRGYQTDSEKMSRVVWDVSPWIGQSAQIEITDLATGKWGHINADDFRYGG